MTDPTTTLDVGAPAEAAAPTTPFRWRLAHRPDVRFGHAAGGVAGILVAAAFVAFVVAVTGDDATVPGVAFNAGLVALALLAGWKVRGPVRSAAVAALVIAVPLVWLFAVVGDGKGGGRGDYRLILLLTIASYVVLYLLTWTRGRAILLGLALLFGANWIVFEIAKQDVPLAVGVVDQARTGETGGPSGVLGTGDKQTEAGVTEVVIAVVLLGGGVLLDRRKRAGAATPCLLVGGFYAVSGAFTLGVDVNDVYATGAFVAVAGLAIGLAGSVGRRRGTSWIGALVLLGGVVTIIGQGTADTATGNDATATRFGFYALLGAAALLVVGMATARTLGEPIDGGEPAPPPRPAAPPAPAVPATAETAAEVPAAPEAPAAPAVAWSAEPPSSPAAETPATEPPAPPAEPPAADAPDT